MHYLGDKIKCENPRLTSSPRYFLNQVLLKRIYNRHYIAKTQEELQDIVNRLVNTGRKYGMEINIDKSQVPRSDESLQIKVNN